MCDWPEGRRWELDLVCVFGVFGCLDAVIENFKLTSL